MTTVIVLGHHRGGTSLVAGLLNEIGVRMGPKGARPDWSGHHWSNPAGHYENPEFVWLNATILAFDGAGIHESPTWKDVANRARPFHERIAATVHSNEGGLWGWKDPWNVLTLEVYLPSVTDPRLVILHRDPQAVAASIYRRDGTGPMEAVGIARLWEERMAEIARRYPEIPRLELRYEEVVEAPEKAIDRLAGFVGLAPSPEQRRAARGVVMDVPATRREAKRLALRELATFPKWLGWFVGRRIQHHLTDPGEILRSALTEFTGAFRTALA
ncbi:MAG: sulfotransferase [Candidatus Lutacidiplasmatales archaeon]